MFFSRLKYCFNLGVNNDKITFNSLFNFYFYLFNLYFFSALSTELDIKTSPNHGFTALLLEKSL